MTKSKLSSESFGGKSVLLNKDNYSVCVALGVWMCVKMALTTAHKSLLIHITSFYG